MKLDVEFFVFFIVVVGVLAVENLSPFFLGRNGVQHVIQKGKVIVHVNKIIFFGIGSSEPKTRDRNPQGEDSFYHFVMDMMIWCSRTQTSRSLCATYTFERSHNLEMSQNQHSPQSRCKTDSDAVVDLNSEESSSSDEDSDSEFVAGVSDAFVAFSSEESSSSGEEDEEEESVSSSLPVKSSARTLKTAARCWFSFVEEVKNKKPASARETRSLILETANKICKVSETEDSEVVSNWCAKVLVDDASEEDK